LHRRIVWAIGGAAAAVGVPVVTGLVLRALGLINDSSLHTFLLDVGHHVKHLGPLGGAGGAAGGAGSPDPPKDPDDPCAGEARALAQAQGTVGMLEGQIDAVQTQIDNLAKPMVQALNQAAALAPAAQTEVAQQFALTAATKLLQLAGGEAGEAVSGIYGLASDPGGTAVSGLTSIPENINFFTEMYQYFQVSQGNLDALKELCQDNPLPEAQNFLNAINTLEGLVAQGHALVNNLDAPDHGLQQQLTDAKAKVDQYQKDLDNCQASHSGDGSSGGGGDTSGGDDGGSDADV
jgi:hypothetical protein